VKEEFQDEKSRESDKGRTGRGNSDSLRKKDGEIREQGKGTNPRGIGGSRGHRKKESVNHLLGTTKAPSIGYHTERVGEDFTKARGLASSGGGPNAASGSFKGRRGNRHCSGYSWHT